jgi:hypothetical protein
VAFAWQAPLVGSGDIQSLADLANSFEVVRTMQIAPITRDALLRLLAATLAPLVPLALTTFLVWPVIGFVGAVVGGWLELE